MRQSTVRENNRPRLLNNLEQRLGYLQRADPWTADFVRDLCAQFDRTPNMKLSDKQFQTLLRKHQRHCKH